MIFVTVTGESPAKPSRLRIASTRVSDLTESCLVDPGREIADIAVSVPNGIQCAILSQEVIDETLTRPVIIAEFLVEVRLLECDPVMNADGLLILVAVILSGLSDFLGGRPPGVG